MTMPEHTQPCLKQEVSEENRSKKASIDEENEIKEKEPKLGEFW